MIDDFKNQLILGDCLEVMPQIPEKSIDLVLADLPYGTTGTCKWDVVIPFDLLWNRYERLIKPDGAIVLFGAQPFTSLLITSQLKWFKYCWVWEKTHPTGFLNAKNKPLKGFEEIAVFSPSTTANGSPRKMKYFPQMGEGKPYRKTQKHDRRKGVWEAGTRTPFFGESSSNGERYPTGILKFSNNNHGSLHPTQKPVPLLSYLIRTYTNPSDLVLDNTMGSASTIAACLETQRNYIGIEKDPEIYAKAVQRIENLQPQLSIFDVSTSA